MEELDLIFINEELKTNFISQSQVNWFDLSQDSLLNFTDAFIEKYDKLIKWTLVSQHKNLSNSFIRKYEKKLVIPLLCTYQKLDDELIYKYSAEKSNLFFILSGQKLSIKTLESLIEKYPDAIHWNTIITNQVLTESFIEKYIDHFDITEILSYQKVSEDFILRHVSVINEIIWGIITRNQKLSESFIEKYKNNFPLRNVFHYQLLSEEFIEKLINGKTDSFMWSIISTCQVLSEEFIIKHSQKINWRFISRFQKLSESFIEKYKDKLEWDYISKCQVLSEGFINKFQDKVNWDYISIYQKLSESFIEKFKKKVNWGYIAKFQSLSEYFVKKQQNLFFYFSRTYTLRYQKFSKEYLRECYFAPEVHDLWQYKDTEFKKEKLIETGKYECYEDYFIAYKAIRSDRYSLYNFQYQYLPGEIYESNCDCTEAQDSFGLNVGTYDFANAYLCKDLGIIVKCKVYYEDIGRIVHSGEKVRCFKIEVLE